MSIVLTPFARTRLFPGERPSNTIQDCTPEAFERHLNDAPPPKVLDRYAPLSKLHVHRHCTSTRRLTVPVTDANRHPPPSAYPPRPRAAPPLPPRSEPPRDR